MKKNILALIPFFVLFFAVSNQASAQLSNASDMLHVVIPVPEVPFTPCSGKTVASTAAVPTGVEQETSGVDVGANPIVEVDPETGATTTTSEDGNVSIKVSADGNTTVTKVINPKTGKVEETTTEITDNGDGTITIKETVVVDGEIQSETTSTKEK